MARRSKKQWINDLEITDGAFSNKAKKAGKTTARYAQEKASAPGKLGKEARLAKTFAKMKKGKGK